jgi:CheY-like chemotaxis protein
VTLDTQNNRPYISDRERSLKQHARYNIVVITQNEVDLTLMKKLLESMGNCKVYEAGNLKSAFKITSHLSIDLIIVDEKLPSAEGFEIIDKLNKRELLKEVPKILLINNDFKKERYDSYRDINLDFMRKPIDTVLLKARVNTLFKNMHKKPNESIFEEMMAQKIEEAKAFLGIYKSFLEVDENILCIYDKRRNKIIEANRVFMRFFEDIDMLNRILASKHLFRRFVPFMDDANYLNHYPFDEWDKIVEITHDFQFALKIVKDETPYSFSVRLRKTEIVGEEMYVVKLLNNHNYLPETKNVEERFESCRSEVNEALHLLKEEIDEEESKRSYQKIYKMLHQISTLVNVGHESDIIKVDAQHRRDVNAYFIVSSLLKRYASYKTLYLNGVKVDKSLEENQEEIYVPVDPDALQDAVKGIIDSYFTAPVQYDKRRIKVDLYRKSDALTIEIRASERKEEPKEASMIDKLLKKEKLTFTDDAKNDILPKNVQLAIQHLGADVQHLSADGHTIFLITVPIVEKVK